MSIEELKLFEAKEARAHALKVIRHAQNQLGKATIEMDKLDADFQKLQIAV
jgi:hypothetical protein